MSRKKSNKVDLSSDTDWQQDLDSRQISSTYETRKAIFLRIKVLYDKELALFKEAEDRYIKYFGKEREEITK